MTTHHTPPTRVQVEKRLKDLADCAYKRALDSDMNVKLNSKDYGYVSGILTMVQALGITDLPLEVTRTLSAIRRRNEDYCK